MKYILDFDHTLMDTERFVQQVKLDGKYGQHITPDIWSEYSVRDYLYDDVLEWLRTKPKESIHILTAMTPSLGELACEFQRAKLHSGKFEEIVDGITFMIGDKGEYVRSLSAGVSCCFVDDSITHHQSVRKLAPEVISVLMCRPENNSVEPTVESGIYNVSNLAELDAIIKEL